MPHPCILKRRLKGKPCYLHHSLRSFTSTSKALHIGPVQEILRARHLSLAQITALEEAWRQNPKATVDEIEKPSADEEAAPVALT